MIVGGKVFSMEGVETCSGFMVRAVRDTRGIIGGRKTGDLPWGDRLAR